MLNISTRVCVKHGGFLRFCLFPSLNALPSPFANDCYTHTVTHSKKVTVARVKKMRYNIAIQKIFVNHTEL